MLMFQVIEYEPGPAAVVVPILGGLKQCSLAAYWWGECAKAFIGRRDAYVLEHLPRE